MLSMLLAVDQTQRMLSMLLAVDQTQRMLSMLLAVDQTHMLSMYAVNVVSGGSNT